ncbi:MAG TPA: HesA/MoeB/ThiF family protein [candidate division Zixibacteria bacterium]|nr:HesA/MoeB/ThiF family protein [candidate division Zixibacteria bacterium]MDD4918197.1 HesA/MoeB/ThiF family protein [candidate division Zixibacteria bacterium]MDM7973701.1 HesA/MoeB/ThiF family protein [candidate division Zixibacteria bacterium]HOD66563.1 HesA/MoeB/ThiF family protein [candidate division Zixibacteria bacterium]HPI33274.1 HesA/MoeB/ThiF family protein [candidate division Zixibacteria bacterium]
MERYRRQLPVDRWNQDRLKSARVLVVGAGGLGGISATCLAAAGVGHLCICDGDRVELSNLNRQFLFAAGDIGKPKAVLAAEKLAAQNPEITVEAIPLKLTEDNAGELASGCDVIIDGLDNHAGRLILNDVSFRLSIPYVYGAIHEWLGQLSFLNPPKTACLACLLHKDALHAGPTPVFGALPGVIGSLQATLALRYLMTGDMPVSNTLLIFRADTMAFEMVGFEKRPDCRVCGKPVPPDPRP